MSVTFIKKGLRSEIITFTMEICSPYFELVKEVTMRLIEAGICQEWLSYFNLAHDRSQDEVPALVLTLEDLAVGFLVCMIPLTLSVIAFIYEVAVPKIKTLAIKTRDLLTFVFLIRAFAGIKRISA